MMRFTTIATSTVTATAFLLPSLLILAPAVHALDPDCTLPNGDPYNGYALKTGTGCRQYVKCQNGIINGWLTCPNNLLYSGDIAEGGICNHPGQVQCADEATAAHGVGGAGGGLGGGGDASASAPPPRVDEDCALPPDTPDTAPLYTGYALKSGTQCKQYVHCTSGLITSWHTCPNELEYSGNVAEPGICNYPEAVQCADPALSSASDEKPAPSTGSDGNTDYDADEATPSASSSDEDEATSSVSSAANPENYFCGNSVADAEQICMPCPSGFMAECNSDQHGCFRGIDSCADAGVSGNSGANGGSDDSGAPSGASSQSDQGTSSSSSNNYNEVMSFSNSNNIDSNAIDNDSNPDNFFCGTSLTNAQQSCIPCPSGLLAECNAEGEFKHGCFKGVDSCASGGSSSGGTSSQGSSQGSGNNADAVGSSTNSVSVPATSGASSGASAQSSQGSANNSSNNMVNQSTSNTPGSSTSSASVPAPEPTLPPWTNAPFNPSPTNTDKTVIGYYASWQWYDREKFADPQNIDFSKYDRINYAFFQPDIHGNLYGTDSWGDPQILWGPYVWNSAEQIRTGRNANYFCSWDLPLVTGRNCAYHDTSKGLVDLAHAAGVEIMPSIGGWTLSDNFPGIAASAEKRQNFAEQCVELIQAYGFDGIDIDWEYPGYEDHSGTPEDTINFTLFLQAIRDELDLLGNNRFGEPYGLTAALPCGPDKIEKIQVDQIMNILTELNLMSYDLHGAWDVLTGTNAPMFDQGWTDETPRWSVHGCVNNYIDLGVPLAKMNIGLPFYGRSFQGATGMKQFHGGADDINYHLDEGSPQYFNIVNELSRMTTYRHENTQTQYATFNTGGGLVSYDDPRAICDKVAYANERGMHGCE